MPVGGLSLSLAPLLPYAGLVSNTNNVLTQDNQSPATDTGLPDALHADIRDLGAMLGDVLAESGDPGLLEDVEALRHAAIRAHRTGNADDFAAAEQIVASFSVERAAEVARAFTVFFHLTNLAEETNRIRQIRAGNPEIEVDVDTVTRAIAQLTEELGAESAEEHLQNLRFHPVFTAHPTEARRRAVSASIRRLAALLEQRQLVSDDSADERRIQRLMREEIDVLWRTSPVRSTRPGPEDEVRTIMSIYDHTLHTAVPRIYRRIDDELLGAEAGNRKPVVPAFIRLGTWVGGDRDGNPYVTATVTQRAMAIASDHVLRGLGETAHRTARSATLDAEHTRPSAALTGLLQQMATADPEGAAATAIRAPSEPHKQVLTLIARRIDATHQRNVDLAYTDPQELLNDLQVVQDSLVAAGALRQAYGTLQTLIWQVQTFGFHLAELEVRQHSVVHARTLAELEELAGGADPDAAPSAEAEEVLSVFRTIEQLQRRYGPQAAGRYIVSFTQGADDLEAVYRLRELSGAKPVLDVIPLFETYSDLENATAILSEAIREPHFAARLRETGGQIEVMLGYSDSSKDAGPVSASLALYRAQANIAQWALDEGLTLTLFHGRGGALGRGGGPTNTAILAQPPHSVDGRFKLTEQGEVVFARYGDIEIAERHIDQVAAATLLTVAPSIEERNVAAAEKYAPVAQVLNDSSRAHFEKLVNSEGFAPWFATVTPMEEIGELQLGSRPARRGVSVEALTDLRAIPWVFAWSQARINLAGWYGLGTALETVGDEELLRKAYGEWPLFRTIIDNVAMSLAKANPHVARQYLELADRPDLTQMVMDEMALTQAWLIRIVGGDDLLANRPSLHAAVQLRAPYVDALSLLQVLALRHLRTGTEGLEGDEELRSDWDRLLLLTVSGVSAGLQNTG